MFNVCISSQQESIFPVMNMLHSMFKCADVMCTDNRKCVVHRQYLECSDNNVSTGV